MNYIQLIILDIRPNEKQLEEFLSILSNESNYPILIHCQHGTHRSGVMAAIYRMEIQGWSNEKAYEEMTSGLFPITFHHTGKARNFIRHYKRSLKEK